MSFVTKDLSARTSDGRNFILEEPLVYEAADGKVYRAPIGSTTDGISSPSASWLVIAPFGHLQDGVWIGWKSGVMHDAGYRKFLEVETHDGNWIKANFDQGQCDDLLDEMLESEGMEKAIRIIVFDALREFGKTAFAEDRAAIAA